MSNRSRRGAAPYFAGWLFADLLLVIVLVVLGSQVTQAGGADQGKETKSPTPTAGESGRPEPTDSGRPTSSPRPAGLDPTTQSISVRADADEVIAQDADATASVRHQVVRKITRFDGRTAAFVMVFGTVRGPGGGMDTGRSDAYATAVAKLLPKSAPAFFPPYSKKIIRGYHDGSPAIKNGTARIELFFLQR
ncbi:hypothetical protein [Streptomyces sp. NPDC005209]|uniref:hypothetical protein n=1 Tax=Streptomyces sp. NPDC005209 TaxID=3156715 RepID=UPI0033BCBE92